MFQSTRPVRDATPRLRLEQPAVLFQSTRPVRDATGKLQGQQAQLQVSIHASRAGRDRGLGGRCGPQFLFQSTRPVRDATS